MKKQIKQVFKETFEAGRNTLRTIDEYKQERYDKRLKRLEKQNKIADQEVQLAAKRRAISTLQPKQNLTLEYINHHSEL